MTQPTIAVTDIYITPNSVEVKKAFKISVEIIELTKDRNAVLPMKLGQKYRESIKEENMMEMNIPINYCPRCGKKL